MMPTDHAAEELLWAHLDGDLAPAEARRLEAHLVVCDACAGRRRDLERVSSALRRLPVERAPGGMPAAVLTRLGIARSQSLLFTLLEHAALGLGMLMVLGTVLGAFLLSGVITTDQVRAGGSVVQEGFASAGGWIGGAAAAMSHGLRTYAPFLADTQAAGITMSVVVVLALLAGADRVLGRRVFPRP